MATAATPSTPTTTPARGFPELACIKCGESGSMTLGLTDLDEFHCGQCDNDFTREDVLAQLNQWQAVLAWIDLAPAAS
jgi:hypothetical protein